MPKILIEKKNAVDDILKAYDGIDEDINKFLESIVITDATISEVIEIHDDVINAVGGLTTIDASFADDVLLHIYRTEDNSIEDIMRTVSIRNMAIEDVVELYARLKYKIEGDVIYVVNDEEQSFDVLGGQK